MEKGVEGCVHRAQGSGVSVGMLEQLKNHGVEKSWATAKTIARDG
jgi:hypothetical protein